MQICVQELGVVKEALKGKRNQYIKQFDAYKHNLNKEEYLVLKGALVYLYEFSRVNSLDMDRTKRLLKIHAIPNSHILHYTNKQNLEIICKSLGLSYSGKKSEDLIQSIRTML